MNNRNLLLFSYDYPPSNGGIARLCQEIAAGMGQYYNTITVLTRKKTGESKPYNFDQIKVVELPSQRGKCEFSAWTYLLKLKQKNNTDVLCGLWHPEGMLCLLAGLKNVFVLGHGTEFLTGTSGFKAEFWLPVYAKWVLGRVKKVIANSNYTKSLIYKINPKASVLALPLGVNKGFFKPLPSKTSNKLKICTVSRVLQFKGHDFIARSIAALPSTQRECIQWDIGGTGPYLAELKILVNDLGIAKNVDFKGFIPDEDLPQFYNDHDLFVLCTRASDDSTQVEGFGLVFLEAQACGLPVIGTNTGGIPDAVVQNNGGWLIEQDNQTDLLSLLVDFIRDPELLLAASLKARQRVEQSANWDVYCEKLNQMLN